MNKLPKRLPIKRKNFQPRFNIQNHKPYPGRWERQKKMFWPWTSPKVNLFHSKNSIALRSKDGKETSLAEVCKATIPDCHLNPFLMNGHLQTIWTVFDPWDDPIYYKRKTFEAEDELFAGTFAVDFMTTPFSEKEEGLPSRIKHFTENELKFLPSEDSKPMLVVLHGLNGGGHESYVRHVLSQLMKDHDEWEACVVISRGCAGHKLTSSLAFNARGTWDLRQVVKWLRATFPNRPLFGIGFSAGANVITNYCGEEGDGCQLKAAIAVSNPWNVELIMSNLANSWTGREIYARAMGKGLRKYLDRNIRQVAMNPRIDMDALQKATYSYEFDALVQTKTWGYPSVDAYYRDASSCDSLLGIRIPFLAINAEDDPISQKAGIPYSAFEVTPYTVLCTTPGGGHIGWFETGGTRWFTKPVINFINTMAKDINLKTPMTTNWKPERMFHSKLDNVPWYDPMRRRLELPQ